MATAAQLARKRDEIRRQVAGERKRVDAIRDRLHDLHHSIRLGVKHIGKLQKRIDRKGADDISDKGGMFIARWEGGILHTVYADSSGYATIGIGHLLHMSPPTAADRKLHWDDDKALSVFHDDAQLAVQAINDHVKVKLDQPQFDALVSWLFNCGSGILASSTLLKRLNAGEYKAVPSELLRWDMSAGQHVEGLHNRRVAEGKLFADGDYGA